MNTIQITNLSVDELKELLKNSLEQSKANSPWMNSPSREERYATRKEVAKSLHICLPTLHELTKTGILTGYKIQGRVLYKWPEIDQALTRIETIRYKRGQ